MKKNLIIAGILSSMLIFSGCSGKNDLKDVKAITIDKGMISKEIKIGSAMKIFTLKDQFDKKHKLSLTTKKLIFVATKATGHLTKGYLNKKPLDYLTKRDILFVADVSKMPSIIYKMFALPDLQKHKYPILIIEDEEIGKAYKSQKNFDKVMIVTLDNLVAKSVQYVTNEADLKKAID